MKLLTRKDYPFYKNQVPHRFEINNYTEFMAVEECLPYFKSKYVYLIAFDVLQWASLYVSHKPDLDILKIRHPKLFVY